MPPRPRSAARRAGRARLSRSAEFERVYRHGRSHANRYLVVYDFPHQTAEAAGVATDTEPRLGLSVSRRVGGAVERNRVKRMLREAFAAERHTLGPHRDIVVVARPDARELSEREGQLGVRRALAELLDRSGARRPGGPGEAPPDRGGDPGAPSG